MPRITQCPTCLQSTKIVTRYEARKIRRTAGWTLRQLAEHAGVHFTYLSKIERGRTPMSFSLSRLYMRLASETR